ncbi:hypothetical protein CHUAL_003690 [Chamberlinius hualienensis]
MSRLGVARLVGSLRNSITPWSKELQPKSIQFKTVRQYSSTYLKASKNNPIGTYSTVLTAILFWTAFINYKKNMEPTYAVSLPKRKENEDKMEDPSTLLLAKADQLYEQVKYDELHSLLIAHKDSNNDEILWRLARVLYRLSNSAESAAKKKQMLTEAKDYVYKALEINEASSPGHKWASILVVKLAECIGTKEKLLQSFVSKKHMLRANELNPKDATVLYLLGVWCYSFADLSWTQRKIASVVFAAPPTSSYFEAQNYFLKAEEVDPRSYSMNFVMLAKTYVKMDDKPRAIECLKAVFDFPQKSEDDVQAHREAKELLKQLGVH